MKGQVHEGGAKGGDRSARRQRTCRRELVPPISPAITSFWAAMVQKQSGLHEAQRVSSLKR